MISKPFASIGLNRIIAVTVTTFLSVTPCSAQAENSFIGMRVQGMLPVIAQGLGIDPPRGVMVRDVATNGPADLAGIVSGDVLIGFNGEDITDFDRLIALVSATRSNQPIPLEVWRNGKVTALTMRTTRWPKSWRVKKDVVLSVPDSGLTLATMTEERRAAFTIRWGVTGLVITGVEATSLAHRQGLRAGDVIRAVNQKEVWEPAQIKKAIIRARNRQLPVIVLLVEQPTGMAMVPIAVAN